MPFLVTDNGSGEVIKTAYERLFLAFYGWSLKTDGDKGAYNVYYATLMLTGIVVKSRRHSPTGR